VIAEGAWSETYADCEGLRGQFHNAAEFYDLYPAYRTPEELSLCAPRPEYGPKLDKALRPLVARATSNLSPGSLRGSIDRIVFPWKIEGWAHDEAHPELPVLLEVLLDNLTIGTVLACDFRKDLLEAGIGQGRCSFTFRSEARLPPEVIETLQIRRVADGATIRMTADCKAGLDANPTVVRPVLRLRLVA
jgi:hypothetical protein